ncbi:MAG TPA: circadian clock KaiB family protein [Gemmatimonadaceae bacterium]|nr:circadian clock KaiB family protein [Gemmatimonadaceae bacterium]
MGNNEPIVDPSEGAASSQPRSKFLLTLYVAGADSRARIAIANLRRICDEELVDQYELEIIDVLEQPDKAEDAKILATPTLIKQLPPPLRRVIGDLSDKDKVLLGLEVRRSPSNLNPEKGGQ